MEFAKQFRSALSSFCGKRGGQALLVKHSGVGQTVLSRILSGETKDPGLMNVSALMDAMGFRIADSEVVGDCAEVRQQLSEAQEKIAALEKELYQAQGEIRSLQGICERAMELLAQKQAAPAIGQGKSYALPESNAEENVG